MMKHNTDLIPTTQIQWHIKMSVVKLNVCSSLNKIKKRLIKYRNIDHEHKTDSSSR